MRSAIAILCGLTVTALPNAQDAPPRFDMIVLTSDTGVSLEAVAGCDWTRLEFSSGEQPHCGVVTSRGVRTVKPGFDPSTVVLDDQDRFAFFVTATADGFTAKALRGCEWTSLDYQVNGGDASRAHLSQRGVDGAQAE